MPTDQEETEILAAINQLIERLNPTSSLVVITIPNEDIGKGDVHSLNSLIGNGLDMVQALAVMFRYEPMLLLAFTKALQAFHEGVIKNSQEITAEVDQLMGTTSAD